MSELCRRCKREIEIENAEMMPTKVKFHRLRLGLNQKDFAAKVGIDVKTLTRAETGSRSVSEPTKRWITVALGFDQDEIEKVFPCKEEGA